ncbi:MAG: sulfotransferase, partial [Pseudomonadota bacterium]
RILIGLNSHQLVSIPALGDKSDLQQGSSSAQTNGTNFADHSGENIVKQRLHFISGLPRSGSTLLSAILRQNPSFHAGMTSPLGPVVNSCIAAMGAENEFSVFFKDEQKRDILHGIFRGYYEHVDAQGVVFDTNRMWTSRIAALRALYPGSKMICCVRNPAWILDSVERLIRKNALDQSRMFMNPQERSTVYARAEALVNRNRMIGFAWSALKEAYYGDDADMMLLVEYDLLAARPAETMELIYQFLGEEPFDHDFENVEYTADEFDTQLLVKDLHTVTGRVEFKPRRTVLPPDLYQQFANLVFWQDGRGTKANHIVITPPADQGGAPAGS